MLAKGRLLGVQFAALFEDGLYERISRNTVRLAEKLNELLDPFRERRAYYEAHKGIVKDIINTGSEKANRIGDETVAKVKEAMSLKI